jgi:hypothetical protein
VFVTIAILDEEECGNLIVLGTFSPRQDVHVRKWVTAAVCAVAYTILRYCRIHITDEVKLTFLSL